MPTEKVAPTTYSFSRGAEPNAVASPVGEISVREQYLRRTQPMLPEARFIYLYQAHLPDRRSRLQFVHRVRTSRPTQTLHSLGNGAA